MLKVGDRVIIKRDWNIIHFGEIIEKRQRVNLPFETSYKLKINNKEVWVWWWFVFKSVVLCA